MQRSSLETTQRQAAVQGLASELGSPTLCWLLEQHCGTAGAPARHPSCATRTKGDGRGGAHAEIVARRSYSPPASLLFRRNNVLYIRKDKDESSYSVCVLL